MCRGSTEANPLLDPINILKIHCDLFGDDHGPTNILEFFHPDCLPNVERLMLDCRNWEGDINMQTLEDWLDSRKTGSHPQCAIQFVNCEDTVRPFFFRVMKTQLANTVEWVTEDWWSVVLQPTW